MILHEVILLIDMHGCVSFPFHNRFLCSCPPGYYGSLCELDVNECETLPCLHGGSCFNKPGGYQCVCAPGFTGTVPLQSVVETNQDLLYYLESDHIKKKVATASKMGKKGHTHIGRQINVFPQWCLDLHLAKYLWTLFTSCLIYWFLTNPDI